MITLYWFLQNDETGESEVVGSYSECATERDRIAKKLGEEHRITFENRRRKMAIHGMGSWTIGRVTIPVNSV